MKKLYTIQVTVAVDDAAQESLIAKGRKLYSELYEAPAEEEEDIEAVPSADEAVKDVSDALIEMISSHPDLHEDGVELHAISCTDEDVAQPSGADKLGVPEPEDDELDEYGSGVYLCRWPNGDFSIVAAATKREAIIALDEFGEARATFVHSLDSFMADFQLTDEGQIQLIKFSEEATDQIWELSYPGLLDLVGHNSDDSGQLIPGGRERVLEAVEAERHRLRNQPKDESASTELGKTIAEQMGMSGVAADHYVERMAKRILESDEGNDGKPN